MKTKIISILTTISLLVSITQAHIPSSKVKSNDDLTLNTGTLTYSDLENKTEYSNIGFGSSGLDSPMAGDKQTETNTAISSTITVDIKDKAKQTQDISKISNDTEHAHYRIQEVNKEVLNIRKDVATQTAKAGFEYIGDLGTQALKDGDNSWEDGGLKKTIAHTLMGGLVSTIGGNGFKSGAVGAGSREGLSSLTENSNNRTQSLVSQMIGASANILTGGSSTDMASGASVANSGEKYNRQLHQDEIKFIKANTNKFTNENLVLDLFGTKVYMSEERAKELLLSAGMYMTDKDTRDDIEANFQDTNDNPFTKDELKSAISYLTDNRDGKKFQDNYNTQELATQLYFNPSLSQDRDNSYDPNQLLGLGYGDVIVLPVGRLAQATSGIARVVAPSVFNGGKRVVSYTDDVMLNTGIRADNYISYTINPRVQSGVSYTGNEIRNIYYEARNWGLQPKNIEKITDFTNGYFKVAPNPNNSIESTGSLIKWMTQ